MFNILTKQILRIASFLAIATLLSFTANAEEVNFQNAHQTTPPHVNFNTPGNLAPNYNLKCMTLSEAKNTYNPPALYIAALNCLDLDRYWDSFELAMLARIYGLYDTKRVTDNSAHQAIIVLDMEFSNALRENEMLKFQGFSKEYAIGTPKGAEACKEWVKKGHPNYHPDYMIKHGMKATLDILAPPENGQGLKKEDEIVKDFNPDKSFADVLKNAHNCPA